jgi:alpha-1,6-mannosyltransferase
VGRAASWRRTAGAIALGALVIASVPLAAPGVELVPGADAGSPRWLLGAYGGGLEVGGDAYLTAFWIAFAAYLGVFAFAGALGRRVVRCAIVCGAIAFALAPPLLSLDVFSYISYARLVALHGLNPYDVAPAAIPDDLAASRVQDYRDATSVYGPLFTVATYPLGLIGVAGALWTLKAVSAVSVLGIAGLVARLAAVRGVSPAPAAAMVALNPLVLVHVIGGPHIDGLMALAVLAGVAMVLAAGEAAGGASIVAGAAVKAPAAVAAPFALLGARTARRRVRLLSGAALAAALIAACGLAVFGSSALHGFSAFTGSQETVSYHSIPATVARITDLDLSLTRGALAAAYGIGVVWLFAWAARGGDWIRATAWAALGLLCATVYLTPWYLIWALPLVAVARDRAMIALTLALCAYQLSVAVPA